MLIGRDIKAYVEQNPRLVRVKEDERTGLKILKYHNRVFYDNTWTPMLQKMRGLVVDNDYEPVIYPFDKVYNFQENGTVIPPWETVTIVHKVNGFMASARYVPPYGLLIASTGTMDSEYVALARRHLIKFEFEMSRFPDYTFIFEIVDESDPHIVVEEAGAYLIGARQMNNQRLMDPFELHINQGCKKLFSCIGDFVIPPHQEKFKDVLANLRTVSHEGYMVYGEKTTLKLKSPYYLTTKLLGRMNPEKLTKYLEQGKIPWMDEDYQWIMERLAAEKEVFIGLSSADRIKYVRSIIDEERELAWSKSELNA